jgi:hypothetical protein
MNKDQPFSLKHPNPLLQNSLIATQNELHVGEEGGCVDFEEQRKKDRIVTIQYLGSAGIPGKKNGKKERRTSF